MKIAVVLFNLGGPTSLSDVKPFLFNLFSDPAIINVPNPFRRWIATFIAARRTPEAQHIYKQIGGGSPLRANTETQRTLLEQYLQENDRKNTYKVFMAMRYWHPMISEVMTQVKVFTPDHIVLLPLYPQFSTTTTGSSFQMWAQEARQQGLEVPTRSISSYPTLPGFIEPIADSIRQALLEIPGSATVLFSAHGLPERIVRRGDPYATQVLETAKAVALRAGLDDTMWRLCFQSRVGPLRWTEPSTDTVIKDICEMPDRKKRGIILIPISFVSEHSETVYEMDIQYAQLAQSLGASTFIRIPTVATDSRFIKGLAELVLKAL